MSKFNYDEKNDIEKKFLNHSYIRLKPSMYIDDILIDMPQGFPKLIDNKYVQLKIPKFRKSLKTWFFVDLNYVPPSPPLSFKHTAEIIFYLILVTILIGVTFFIIRRNKIKNQLMREENHQNLNQISVNE